MTTLQPDFRCLKRTMRGCAAVLWLLALFVNSHAARADVSASDNKQVTAVVNEGTLEITRPQGRTGESANRKNITLTGSLTEPINVYVDGELLQTFPREGITKVDILADLSFVNFGDFFQFEGDIVVDVMTGGFCFLPGLDMSGDLLLQASAGTILVDYLIGGAFVDGNLTIKRGGIIGISGVLGVTGDLNIGTDALGGRCDMEFAMIGGDLNIAGGPFNSFVRLHSVFVGGQTQISLGQSQGGTTADQFDADWCGILFCTFEGDLFIDGAQGDDTVTASQSTINGNLFVGMGTGADLVRVITLAFGEDTQIFLDGGNGNSDELILNGLSLTDDEHTGFETVTP